MSIELISSPTVLRRHLRRLISKSERIDVFVPSFSDPTLTRLLVTAAGGGTEVNLTTLLDERTDPAAVEALHEAGAFVGTFEPKTHRRRAVEDFGPGVMIFDSEAEWWTAALVGSFTATQASLERNLEVITLTESEDFTGADPAGTYLLQILNWGDSVNHAPIDDRAIAAHRRLCGAAETEGPEDGPAEPGTPREPEGAVEAEAPAEPEPSNLDRIIEAKPASDAYVSSLSWQELRRCDWGAYWSALLEADERRGSRRADGLFRPNGWLYGIDAAQGAFAAGPDAWEDEEIRNDLLGLTPATGLIGRVENETLAKLIATNPTFRNALHQALERCITDGSPGTMFHALAPIVGREGVSIANISRILAAAAPDRFFSIAEEPLQVRMSSMVGFDLAERATASHDQLRRFVDAIEMTREFPWASEQSAERSSDHPRESDAWSKRVALLACLVV